MKQPRTKCRTNQHQKRATVPVFAITGVDQDTKAVTFDYRGERVAGREEVLEQKLWTKLAESLGYRLGQGKDLW